jgi:hypothetical protein
MHFSSINALENMRCVCSLHHIRYTDGLLLMLRLRLRSPNKINLQTLSKQQPRLITTFRPVRRGTNGGVTLLGFAASLAGGVFIGLCFYVAGLLSPGKAAVAHRPELIAELPLVLLGGAAGKGRLELERHGRSIFSLPYA